MYMSCSFSLSLSLSIDVMIVLHYTLKSAIFHYSPESKFVAD